MFGYLIETGKDWSEMELGLAKLHSIVFDILMMEKRKKKYLSYSFFSELEGKKKWGIKWNEMECILPCSNRLHYTFQKFKP